jgi:hypothetical protein
MMILVLQQRLNLRDLLTNMCRGEALWDEHRPLLSPITELVIKLCTQCGKKGLGKEECEKRPRKQDARMRGRLPKSRTPVDDPTLKRIRTATSRARRRAVTGLARLIIRAMSMVVVHVASGTRDNSSLFGRMAEAMGYALH